MEIMEMTLLNGTKIIEVSWEESRETASVIIDRGGKVLEISANSDFAQEFIRTFL
jgi:2-keto-3-deoxy-6-phosphogluconate aldolase